MHHSIPWLVKKIDSITTSSKCVAQCTSCQVHAHRHLNTLVPCLLDVMKCVSNASVPVPVQQQQHTRQQNRCGHNTNENSNQTNETLQNCSYPKYEMISVVSHARKSSCLPAPTLTLHRPTTEHVKRKQRLCSYKNPVHIDLESDTLEKENPRLR